MKNNFLTIIIFFILHFTTVFADNLNIQSNNILIDKKSKSTIFRNNVVVTDKQNNVFKTDYAEYQKDVQLLKSVGETKIRTSNGYYLTGEDILFDNKNKTITSEKPATIIDLNNNNISLENFSYSTKDNFFKSIGKIQIKDSKNNSYNFTQIYIDERKREIIGTDTKTFLNADSFKVNEKNKPRVFANTVKIDEFENQFTKSVFTLCNYREKDKCPPWALQATEMTHDKRKKTIYYDNAVIKVYDFPIFYLPKLSHPDPTVDRRSGFLPPSFSDSKNLGAGVQIPYYIALDRDKDLTLTSKLFVDENPLIFGQYRQAFAKSNLLFDFGYTQGYKKTSDTKRAGDKTHFFSNFVKNFKGNKGSNNSIEFNLQNVSNDKYLKLYKIESDLVNYETETLENSLSFAHENSDLFFGVKASAFRTLKESYNDRFEYILPDIVVDKNLFSNERYGNADFTSNVNIHNYDTNKQENLFVNDINWKFKNFNYSSGLKGKVLGKLKNINYETKNAFAYKENTTSELFGAIGYLTEIDFFKQTENNAKHLLTPKALFRYSPDHMRKEFDDTVRLNHSDIFSLDRLNVFNNFESGINTTLGFDYKINNSDKEFDFSIGQIINLKENKKMPSSSSLDEKLSDVVGTSSYKFSDKMSINYNFAIDQNYNDINYNEFGTSFNADPFKINFNYLLESKHIGDQEYLKTSFELARGTNGLLNFETKRNLITNSAEFYNLSYEYINDCLRAGLVYRREFYDDSELESENSLMFKLTLIPFGNLNSPSFNK